MSLYRKYTAPYRKICLLLLLGVSLLEVGHYWLHYFQISHHGSEHDHTHVHATDHHHEHNHMHTAEDHSGHEHIKELFVAVVLPTCFKSPQPLLVAYTGKHFIKLELFFHLKQTLYTFTLPFYQASNISVTLIPTSPPPQA